MTGLRDPRELPAGVHLHHPHCRVHRQLHAPRALTDQLRSTHVVLLHFLLAQQDPRPSPRGSDRNRSWHRLRRRRHRPRHRHRSGGRQRHHRDGTPARVGGHRPNHDVPRHRVHRSARALRLRSRVHHLRLKPGQEERCAHRIDVRYAVARRRSWWSCSRRRACVRAGGREHEFEDHAGGGVPRAARRGQVGRRLPRGAEPARSRAERDHLGFARRSWCCSSRCGSGACRR